MPLSSVVADFHCRSGLGGATESGFRAHRFIFLLGLLFCHLRFSAGFLYLPPLGVFPVRASQGAANFIFAAQACHIRFARSSLFLVCLGPLFATEPGFRYLLLSGSCCRSCGNCSSCFGCRTCPKSLPRQVGLHFWDFSLYLRPVQFVSAPVFELRFG
jgi:hypothetical protein